MFKTIKENSIEIKVPVETKISKKLPVFYNPVMKLNRDISVLILNSISKDNLRIADPLAGTGIRSIRFLKELKKGKVKQIFANDISENAVNLIEENLKLNKIKQEQIKIKDKENKPKKGFKINISHEDANQFMLNNCGFDYIDIDPFGCPNYFLDSACKRLSRDSILAVTATDTSALAGTYPKACLRKYWAIPLRDELMHEIGLRILIRKVQLIAAQFEKALVPIFSYSAHHYMRVFFHCEISKEETDKVLKQHGVFEEAGPMWLGSLWDINLVDKIAKEKIEDKETKKFIEIIQKESKINTVGFYNIHRLVKKHKIKNMPRTEVLLEKIRETNKAERTHFNPVGIRSDIKIKELLKILKN